ncbi:hypothetical protein AV530_001210 [Patagioenas fasciata monilis]|uniref:Uncharacterized protein n=1 Tax=Patagioenas fasciata monilis TaxID=372326 RepID=A0A1V4JQ55_PATFA|nr:hypothetical protein AV530_001210 [Patagioenas fasciata monilis]
MTTREVSSKVKQKACSFSNLSFTMSFIPPLPYHPTSLVMLRGRYFHALCPRGTFQADGRRNRQEFCAGRRAAGRPFGSLPCDVGHSFQNRKAPELVNELSLEQFDFEEEEVLSDLSFDDELPSREMPPN